jgi:hypothetical protein
MTCDETAVRDTGIDPAELDVGFVDGTTVTMNVTRDGETEPVVMRAVMFGIGGVLGSVTATVEGGDAVEAAVDDLDWSATMRAAVQDMIAARWRRPAYGFIRRGGESASPRSASRLGPCRAR